MVSRASSDEGEIRDGVEKANTSLPQYDGPSVDRPNRIRDDYSSISKSPEHDRSRDKRSRDRSRSPYYAARGSKRAREDEYPDRSRGDPRKFKVHYEDTSDNKRRSRVSYEDLDGPASAPRYDERDGPSEKRPRTRSRSPYRPGRGGDRGGRGGPSRREDNRYSHAKDSRRPNSYYADVRSRESRDQSVSKRGPSPLPADNARQEAKTTKGYSQHDDSSEYGSRR